MFKIYRPHDFIGAAHHYHFALWHVLTAFLRRLKILLRR